MSELDIPSGRHAEWRSIIKHKQLEMATNLLKEMRSINPDIPKDIDAMTLLDALGCAGLSLAVGEWASSTFIENLETTRPWSDLSQLLPDMGEVES